MNASRLRFIVDLLLEREGVFGVQGILIQLRDNLANLTSQPSQTQYQSAVAEALGQFSTTLDQLRASFEPAQVRQLEELGAAPFFVLDQATAIAATLRDNAMTPQVVNQFVGELTSQRAQFLSDLEILRDKLDVVGIQSSTLEPGEAEVGFTLPRPLFYNRLDGLISELRELDRIIRAFSEAATGSYQPVEVRQISTSDPAFFFSITPEVIVMIGGAVTWALNTWKQLEEIRKLRADTAKNGAFSEADIEGFFGKKITETVEQAIQKEAASLVKRVTDEYRAREQEIHLAHALRSLLARIERGVTVEVRALPPPPPALGEDATLVLSPEVFEQLRAMAPQLVFPATSGTPVLPLPRPPIADERPLSSTPPA